MRRYLDRIAAAVEQVEEVTGGAPVTLLAHSAGGWLSRVFLLEVRTLACARCVLESQMDVPHVWWEWAIEKAGGLCNTKAISIDFISARQSQSCKIGSSNWSFNPKP